MYGSYNIFLAYYQATVVCLCFPEIQNFVDQLAQSVRTSLHDRYFLPETFRQILMV